MNKAWSLGWGVVACLLSACGASPSTESSDGGEPNGAEIQLNLATTGASGTEYRLGPATFDIFRYIDEAPVRTLTADGADSVLHVPLEEGYYSVKLRPGWTLSRVDGQASTAIAATLTSPDTQFVKVRVFETSPVNYAFHLGESGIDIGVTVDEGTP
jgi:hypothetical protein